MGYSLVQIEQGRNTNRADAHRARFWLEVIRKMPDLRADKVESARDALKRDAFDVDDRLRACVDLIHEDMELTEVIDAKRASAGQSPPSRPPRR